MCCPRRTGGLARIDWNEGKSQRMFFPFLFFFLPQTFELLGERHNGFVLGLGLVLDVRKKREEKRREKRESQSTKVVECVFFFFLTFFSVSLFPNSRKGIGFLWLAHLRREERENGAWTKAGKGVGRGFV